MIDRPDFMEPHEWEATVALIEFMRFDVIRSDLALAWMAEGILQPFRDGLGNPETDEDSMWTLCVRFTNRGRKMTKELIRKFGIDTKKLEKMTDPFLNGTASPDATFLMHDRRFRSEFDSFDFVELQKRYETNISYKEALEIYT
jgi:hypothetical protein